MLEMSFPRLTIEEYVIKEFKDKDSEIQFQDFVHEPLEGGWLIAEAKGMTKNS